MTARGSRRTFIAGVGALGAAGVLGGCTVQMGPAWPQAPAQPILPSPEGYTAADVLATPRPDIAELETFLALSSVLTGFDNLDPVLGAVYLSSLRAGRSASDPPRALRDRGIWRAEPAADGRGSGGGRRIRAGIPGRARRHDHHLLVHRHLRHGRGAAGRHVR
jgi:hypothetical protein